MSFLTRHPPPLSLTGPSQHSTAADARGAGPSSRLDAPRGGAGHLHCAERGGYGAGPEGSCEEGAAPPALPAQQVRASTACSAAPYAVLGGCFEGQQLWLPAVLEGVVAEDVIVCSSGRGWKNAFFFEQGSAVCLR